MITNEILEIMLALRQAEGMWPKMEIGLQTGPLLETLKNIIRRPGVLRSMDIWTNMNGHRTLFATEETFAQIQEEFEGPGPRRALPTLPNIDVDPDTQRAQGG